jgi:hypothetical protein
MPPTIQVGTILMKDWPSTTQPLGLESEPRYGGWNVLKALDSYALDRKIHAAGWNFFFIAGEVKVMFLGAVGAAKIESALQGLLRKVRPQNFNSLEITGIVARHFLGVPYVTVSAHSRHMQESCQLDSTEARQRSQHNAEWATG